MGTSRIGCYFNTKGSNRKVSEFALVHSVEGKFVNVGENKRAPIRMESGGHGQDNIDLLIKYRIGYSITKQFSNGVRIGNVERHKSKFKRETNGQAWFPSSWTKLDIRRAGEHVASLVKNKKIGDGYTMYGTYRGVKVGVKKTNGQIATIFPILEQED